MKDEADVKEEIYSLLREKIKAGDTAVCLKIIQQQLLLSVTDAELKKILNIACQFGDGRMIKVIFEILNKNTISILHLPLYLIIKYRTENEILEIFKNFSNETIRAAAETKDSLGLTPLHFVCERGYHLIVKYLIEIAKMDPQIKDAADQPPLYYACKQGDLLMAQYLIEMISIDPRSEKIFGPLPLVMKKNVDYLLQLFTLTQSKPINLTTLTQLIERIDTYKERDKTSLQFLIMRKCLQVLSAQFGASDFQHRMRKLIPIWQSWLKNFEQEYKIQLVPFLISIGNFDLCKSFSDSNLKNLKLDNFKMNRKTSVCLKTLSEQNHGLNELLLHYTSFTRTGYKVFLEALGILKDRLEILVLQHCGLTHDQMLSLISKLNFKELQKLDLEGNYFTHKSLELILKEIKVLEQNRIKNGELEFGLEISLRDNLIEIETKDLFSELSNLIHSNSLLKAIHLEGNIFESKRRNKLFLEILEMLLEKSGLTIEQLLNSEFGPFKKCSDYDFRLAIVTDKNTKEIRFNYSEMKKFNEFNQSIKCTIENEVWDYIKKIPWKLLPDRILKASSHNRMLYKQIANYHPESPLKSYLATHPVFKSSSLYSVKSLLLSEQEITLQHWKIYLLAKKSKTYTYSDQHSMIAYEGLKNNGQRFFKVAHLQAVSHGPANPAKIIVNFFSAKDGIFGLIKYLQEDYILFDFAATRKQINDLHLSIEDDIKNSEKINDRYKYKSVVLGSSMQTDAAKKDVAINCMKWMLDKIKCIDFEIITDLSLTGYIPLVVINKLQSERNSGRTPIASKLEEMLSINVSEDKDDTSAPVLVLK